jgi:hypothetical protein
MQTRLLLSAGLMTALAQVAAAQQTAPQPGTAQPAQTPRPASPAKPKPALKKPLTTTVTPAAKARLLEKIKDWNVFIYEEGNERVCFAATAPTDMQPKTAKRTPVIFYVTTWQKDGVRNEVSVKQGYSMKAKAAATVTIGAQTFTLTADDDKAYAKDPAEERKLLAAMASGGPMVVKATSAKGTATTDQYSLDGILSAVQKLGEACP